MPTLHWIGKDKIINHHQEVPYKVLNHEYGFSENGKTETVIDAGNLIINGDNLEALKSLLPKYEGKVNCIYIDPPYNTGNESWVYNDNVNSPQIKKWLGKIVGKESEDLTRHDKWLCMMYPRLKLLHKLLAKDGAIFISIDDNEQANLKLMMDEIFGAGNFVANIIWQKKYSPQNDARFFSDMHDFIICFAKNKNNNEEVGWVRNLLPRSNEANSRYKNLDNDIRGPWKSSDFSVKTYSKEYDYEITTPSGRLVKPPQGRCWRTSKQNFTDLLKENRIWFGEKGNNVPSIKRFLTEVQNGTVPVTIWLRDEVGDNQEARQILKNIFSDAEFPFDTPKPPRLIDKVLKLSTDKNSIILDSFAGSGTTAHAVLNLNKQDGGNRKFILIEMEDYAETITAERVKRVIKGYGEDSKAVEGTGGNFDYYTLGEPLFDDNNNLNENIAIDKIREYVWYTETRTTYSTSSESLLKDKEVFLGNYNDTGYYFIYDKDNLTTLDFDSLATYVQQKAERYIIYADNCLLPETFLREKNIEFKKIPRDITRF
ncbi:site-specific DNA-methyltransferase [Flavobacterium faecale]|uniref:site-specific DNA-methyltransferase n=1 Tax=Flavobacterium faecale TaxID=1355330 RepID=UPI003AAF0F7D